MLRKAKILLSAVDPKTSKVNEVVSARGLFAVFYKGKPFNLKIRSDENTKALPKYQKISFTHLTHALNMAERLNTLYNTDKFEVYFLKTGRLMKNEHERDPE